MLRKLLVLAAVHLVCCHTTQPVWALAFDGWTDPIDVTEFTARSDAAQIAVDQTGTIHLVWGSTLESSQSGLDTIYYQTVAQGHWSEPSDILVAARGTSAIPQRLDVDLHQRLVLLWLKENGVFVSVSPIATAANAHSWVTTTLENNANVSSAALAIDNEGHYHVLYVRDTHTLIYVRSDDGGISWSEPVTVEEVPPNRAIRSPVILTDEAGHVFASWSYTSQETNWSLAGVAFSRLLDGTNQWEPVQTISSERGYGLSNLFIDSQRRLALTSIGALGVGGRYVQWSNDSGATWDIPITISSPEDIAGAAGSVNILEDSLGQLHAVFSGVGQGKDQIWYSKWSGIGWTDPLSLSAGLTRSERPSVILALGHQIHVLWYEYESQHVWYSTIDLGTPSIDVEPLPASGSDESTILSTIPTSDALTSPELQRYVTQPIPITITLPSRPDFSKELPRQKAFDSPLLWGVMSTILYILLAVLLHNRQTR